MITCNSLEDGWDGRGKEGGGRHWGNNIVQRTHHGLGLLFVAYIRVRRRTEKVFCVFCERHVSTPSTRIRAIRLSPSHTETLRKKEEDKQDPPAAPYRRCTVYSTSSVLYTRIVQVAIVDCREFFFLWLIDKLRDAGAFLNSSGEQKKKKKKEEEEGRKGIKISRRQRPMSSLLAGVPSSSAPR